MSGRNYELFSYCNGCAERSLKGYPKDMLRCPVCNYKLRHKPKSPSAKRREQMNYKRI